VLKMNMRVAEYLERTPEWVNPELLRRGQALYANVYLVYAMVLLGALANGFIISRFSEVLVLSGYATDSRLAGRRFRDTGMPSFGGQRMQRLGAYLCLVVICVRRGQGCTYSSG
jgi:hypothetical protein